MTQASIVLHRLLKHDRTTGLISYSDDMIATRLRRACTAIPYRVNNIADINNQVYEASLHGNLTDQGFLTKAM